MPPHKASTPYRARAGLHNVVAHFNFYIVLPTSTICHQNFAHYGSDRSNLIACQQALHSATAGKYPTKRLHDQPAYRQWLQITLNQWLHG